MAAILKYGLVCILFSQVVFGQFKYHQQFAGSQRGPINNGGTFAKEFDDNRVFRFKPNERPIVERQEVQFPSAEEEAAAIQAQQPIEAPVEAPVPYSEEVRAEPIVKKVKVLKEKIRSDARVNAEIPIERKTNRARQDEEDRLYLQEQAKHAHYSFSSSVQDSINDHSIARAETREGLALKGMYSYSDGFYKRTVHYEADEGGYRVVKEEIEPIGEGPMFNPKGRADVESSLAGSYSITADDINFREKKTKKTV